MVELIARAQHRDSPQTCIRAFIYFFVIGSDVPVFASWIPSPQVGCVPKKIMYNAAAVGPPFGLRTPPISKSAHPSMDQLIKLYAAESSPNTGWVGSQQKNR